MLIPIYSTSGNYNIMHFSSNLTKNRSKEVSTNVYVDIFAYKLINGGLGLNQANTESLLIALGAGAAITTAGILAVGAAVIGWYDVMGGYHGVYFGNQMVWFFPVYWVNAPFNQNSFSVQGTCTIWSGCVA
ncbi:MAG: hypothetical protein ACYCSG_05470 [Thermoplasmataceae archaeon]